jgi:hypothetical protein
MLGSGEGEKPIGRLVEVEVGGEKRRKGGNSLNFLKYVSVY